MSRLDGVSETENLEPEQVEPEKCETPEDFDKATGERADELREQLENDPDANKYADSLASDYSTDEILEMKKDAGDSSEEADAYREACFGEQEGLTDDERAERIGEAKDAWEDSVKDNCLYDMALDRQGYDPSDESAEAAEAPEATETVESPEDEPPSEPPEEPDGEPETAEQMPDAADPEPGGREMDETSKEQLMEKQAETNDFLERNGGLDDYQEMDKFTNWEKSRPDWMPETTEGASETEPQEQEAVDRLDGFEDQESITVERSDGQPENEPEGDQPVEEETHSGFREAFDGIMEGLAGDLGESEDGSQEKDWMDEFLGQ